jgi:hypothetical protein
MNRRRWLWLLTILALSCLAALAAPSFEAQEPEQAEQPAQPANPPPAGSGEEAVEQILRQQEALITGQGFTYNPEGRRDPFRSPFGGIGEEIKRPQGKGGLLVAEIDVTGVVSDPRGGDVAMAMGPDNKGYFLRVGDQVYDGTVIAIDPEHGTVTFRQEVDDPRMIKPYRDVLKRVVPQDYEESGDE